MMKPPPPSGTSLRAWFGLFAVACAWLALFANFLGNARQLLDVVWQLCFDASPRMWMYVVVEKDWRESISIAFLIAAIYQTIRGRPREYSLALLVLGWTFCGWALIVEIYRGHGYSASGPITLYRDFYQMAWLWAVIRNLVPTLVLTLIAQSLGIVTWKPATKSEHWLTRAWLVTMANIWLVLACGMTVVEHGIAPPKSGPLYPSLMHGREIFAPTPPMKRRLSHGW